MATTTGSTKIDAVIQTAKANTPEKLSGLALYSRFALAGAVCCSVTHGALTPVDVVKTKIQLDPLTYNKGMFGTFRQVIAKDGASALLTGFGPTAAGYFLQGAFKFGGYELFKQQSINVLGYETASNNRTAVYLVSAGIAEFFADVALCPLEATRIRLVSEPTYANGLVGGFTKMLKNEGIGAFYAGFGPILFKQQSINILGYETASNNRTAVYLVSAGIAEFFADVALCPLEATRIRLVSEPTYANGLVGGFGKMLKNEGIGAFYAGFGPILFKQ
jgi:solute carrier family 25 phosphate transporter 3